MKYTGPAKPIPTRRKWGFVTLELAAIVAAVVVVALDVFVWRP